MKKSKQCLFFYHLLSRRRRSVYVSHCPANQFSILLFYQILIFRRKFSRRLQPLFCSHFPTSQFWNAPLSRNPPSAIESEKPSASESKKFRTKKFRSFSFEFDKNINVSRSMLIIIFCPIFSRFYVSWHFVLAANAMSAIRYKPIQYIPQV